MQPPHPFIVRTGSGVFFGKMTTVRKVAVAKKDCRPLWRAAQVPRTSCDNGAIRKGIGSKLPNLRQ